MARRNLSSEEEMMWQAFAQTILPLRRRQNSSLSKGATIETDVLGRRSENKGSFDTPSESASLKAEKHEFLRVILSHKSLPKPPDRLEINSRKPGLDTTSWNALSTGKMKPQKRLDLHGHFAQDAFFKLHHFLNAASKQGVRCVEVITGLGSGREGGVIRKELPHWLDRGDIRPLILAVVNTHKKNKGAVRILLKGKRRSSG